ncbi:MAG: alpha/beta fold hydrolase [Alphaproteobacteria bacterium]
MATYVLVHGAFMGAWFWEDMARRLEAAGHRAIAPDLPSQGRDTQPVAGIGLDDYVNRISAIIDDEDEPVILVGHSLGGLTISQTAERRPDRIRKLVYVAAFLLPDGSSPRKFYEDLGVPSPVMGASIMHEDGTVDLKPEAMEEIIFNTSPAWLIEAAMDHLKPTSRKPMATPLELSDGNFGRVPRVYIEALQDKSIPIKYQRMMVEALPCATVITMDTDHSPMFSAPDELERHLLDVAKG